MLGPLSHQRDANARAAFGQTFSSRCQTARRQPQAGRRICFLSGRIHSPSGRLAPGGASPFTRSAFRREDGQNSKIVWRNQTKFGGARRDRTDDLLLAKQALSQLSYGPFEEWPMVGPGRVELPTSRLSGVRSNHLSYGPSKATEINVAVNHGNLIAPASCPIKSVFTSAKKEKRRRRCPAKMLRDFGACI
jgi:hypothetical protein